MSADDQPCEECAQMERKVLAAGIVAGALMGAGVVLFIASRSRKP